MHWRSRKGKSGLIHMLMEEHGFSKRKAVRAVNALFNAMKRALWRGECVELPIGRIWAASRPPGRSKSRWRKFRNIQDGTLFYRLVTLPKKEIHFRKHSQLIEPTQKPKRVAKPGRKPRKVKPRPPLPPPIQPQTPAQEYILLHRQMALHQRARTAQSLKRLSASI